MDLLDNYLKPVLVEVHADGLQDEVATEFQNLKHGAIYKVYFKRADDQTLEKTA